MPTQPSTLNDVLKIHDQRLTALESTSIDDSQPVDMYRAFTETVTATERFFVSTHTYHVCQGYVFVGPGQIEASLPCSTNLKI